MLRKDFAGLFLSIIACEAAGILGSFFTISSIPTWYASLNKPWFNPPNWLFGPAWAILYALMGISLFLAWKKGIKSRQARPALTAFALQLFLNAAWSIIFFGLKMPLAAFAEILLLWLSIAAAIALFWRISRTSALLLVPYLAWVSFAALLNYSIWVLN